jgi:hypothetical protein
MLGRFQSTTASSPSRKRSSIGIGLARPFSARASSSRKAVLDPPSLAPTNRKSRISLVS